MGVVHLARKGDGPPRRAEGAAPAHRRRRRGPRAGWRARSARSSGSAAAGSPRSSTPTRGRRRRTSPPATCPGSQPPRPRAAGGPDHRAPTSAGSPRCLAEGVASVHAVGVLHRDVKPSNVLMEGRTPDPDRLRPRPRRRRPASSPRPAGCSARRATSRPRSCTATTPPPPPTSTRGRRPWRTPAPGRPPFGRGPVDGDHGPRPPRRARPHRPARRPARARRRRPLDPDPTRRPTLREIIAPPRAATAASAPRPPRPVVEDPFTLPLALAAQGDAVRAHRGGAPSDAPPAGRAAAHHVGAETATTPRIPTTCRSTSRPTPERTGPAARLRRGSRGARPSASSSAP